MKKHNAFTLVEILVIIFIIAIFLGISTPSLFSWTKTSQIKSDVSICLEMENIITNAIKSKDIAIKETDYSIDWTLANKNKLRTILKREMTTSPKVSKPKEDGYAFFVYLLPPYSVICLPINSNQYIDTSDLSFNGVTTDFLLERYPKSNYPQMYTSLYSKDSNSIGKPTLNFPVVVKPGDSTESNKNSLIGCINLPTDF